MRTVIAITNPSGFPYQWAHAADYAPRDGSTAFMRIGNPFTMRTINWGNSADYATLLTRIANSGMTARSVAYPYDFSDRIWYTRRNGAVRAPYGL